MTYATGTCVTESESRNEVQRLLAKHGCQYSSVGLNAKGNAVVRFQAQGREVRMLATMPQDSRERNRRWRVLGLLLKAKLEAIATGLSTVDTEFLAHIVTENGHTVGSQYQLPGRTA